MIPALIDLPGAPWKVLPRGIHPATLAEVETTYGLNPVRRELFAGLEAACKALRQAGCRRLFLNGSFVTEKPTPGDFDACWDPDGVDVMKLDPVLLDFANERARQKEKYGGELFPSGSEPGPGGSIFELFQTDKSTGHGKGILEIDLSSETFDYP